MSELSSSVDKIYVRVRQMATNFEFMPGERINESSLSKELGASRTPLREALNRLVAEGFIDFENGRGFFCRALSPEKILSLYEVRAALESEALRLAIVRASDQDIDELEAFLRSCEPAYLSTSSTLELVDLDEEFHMRLVRLSGNGELERMLSNVNARIRYVRCIDMADRREGAPVHHQEIVKHLKTRNEEKTIAALRNHIVKRSEETTEAVKIAYSQLYVPAMN
ncbi:MAG: GntR family transcriptional regulator [Sneathiellales bacterium]|nr:GntR family transcriptional regulator [Sneathiellales bacterium]